MTRPNTPAAVLFNFVQLVQPKLDHRPFFQAVGDAVTAAPFSAEFSTALSSLNSACAAIELWIDSAGLKPTAADQYAGTVSGISRTLSSEHLLTSGSVFATIYSDATKAFLIALDDRMQVDQEDSVDDLPESIAISEALDALRDFVDTIQDFKTSRLLYQTIECLDFAYTNYNSVGPQAVYDHATTLLGTILPIVSGPAKKKSGDKLLKAVAAIVFLRIALAETNELYDEAKEFLENLQEGAAIVSSVASEERKLITHLPAEEPTS